MCKSSMLRQPNELVYSDLHFNLIDDSFLVLNSMYLRKLNIHHIIKFHIAEEYFRYCKCDVCTRSNNAWIANIFWCISIFHLLAVIDVPKILFLNHMLACLIKILNKHYWIWKCCFGCFTSSAKWTDWKY